MANPFCTVRDQPTAQAPSTTIQRVETLVRETIPSGILGTVESILSRLANIIDDGGDRAFPRSKSKKGHLITGKEETILLPGPFGNVVGLHARNHSQSVTVYLTVPGTPGDPVALEPLENEMYRFDCPRKGNVRVTNLEVKMTSEVADNNGGHVHLEVE